MIKKLIVAILVFINCLLYAQGPMTPLSSSVTSGSDWTTTNLTADQAFDFPWEITYGPDDKLWITERVGEKIVRINTTGGTIETLIDLSAKIANSKQGGLMGMAIHPDLFDDVSTSTNNYVYVAYTYNDSGFKLRLARLTYNHAAGTLTEDTLLDANGTLLEGLPGSSDHNSGRLIIGPDLKLYYTIGDQGANQFDFACDPVLSQVLPTSSTDYNNYPGKTLRLNLDGSIPSDNPILNNVQSHVYTYGHRNAQGIIFGEDGTLYNSEHGAKVDDEINVVISGRNYGWPEIAGYYDNMAYSYCNWSSLGGSCNAGDFSDHNCPSGADTATEYESYPTAGDVPTNFQPPIGTYGGTVATDPPGGWFTWPTVAPSSIDIHEANNIPGWGRSLLVATLKKGTIYRAKLTPDGNDIVGDSDVGSIDGYEEFHSSNDRYRDVAISPDGLTIYAVTDNSGGTSGPSSGTGVSIENGGTIVKIEYVGIQVTNPPVAICQNATLTLDADGNGTLLVADINNGSTGGDAGIDTIVIDNDTFDCSHIGTVQTVWLTVTDNNGNESRCSADVTVQPNASPNPFTAPVLDDIISNCEVTVTAPTLINNACAEVTATTTDNITYTSGQSGTIVWTFNDGVNSDTTTQNVMVNALATPSNNVVVPGSTTTQISWDTIDDVTYEIRYRESGTSSWLSETASINSIVLTGLNLSTTYEYQLRSDCGSSQSAYTTIDMFTTTTISYCDAIGANGGHINSVQLSGDNGTSISQMSSGDADYTDYTATSTVDLKANGTTSYTISLNSSYNDAGYSVWIDYNQDGDFSDSDERVWGTTDNNDLYSGTATGVFQVPMSAIAGNTRMRIASRQYWTATNPCGGNGSNEDIIVEGSQSSEVEDYTVNIVESTLSNTVSEISSFAVYPNPVSDKLTIKLPLNFNLKDLKVELYDLQGRLIIQKSIINSSTVITNLSSLNNGVYFVRFKNAKGIIGSKKLIKL